MQANDLCIIGLCSKKKLHNIMRMIQPSKKKVHAHL